MYGRTGEDHPMYGRTGEDAPRYGETGEDHPMYGVTGKDHPNCKLSNDDARSLKWYALYTNLTQAEIGQKFAVSRGYVSEIKTENKRADLDPKPPADNGQLRLSLGAT
jgi:hypothetical protein